MSRWDEAKYKCLGCGHEWKKPKPSGMNTFCLKCDSLYVEWVNYKIWRKFHKEK